MKAIKHILVPTDFSEPSERAVAMALELASTFGARITVLHVWSVPQAGYAEGLTWPIDEMRAAARRALDDTFKSITRRHPSTDAVLRMGLEWKEILDLVEERDIDLIVMGTHGRRGLPRLVLGSVAEKVVRMSPVPVLTLGVRSGEGGAGPQ